MKTLTGSKTGLTVTTSVREVMHAPARTFRNPTYLCALSWQASIVSPAIAESDYPDWERICKRHPEPLRVEPDDSGAFAGVLSALAIELAIVIAAVLIWRML